MDTTKNITKVAELNDEFRAKGQFVLTNGVMNVSNVISLVKAVESYDKFDNDNDPYGEHDFGSLVWFGNKIFWKIDYYNQELNGWGDPLFPECRRILTVMLAEEY